MQLGPPAPRNEQHTPVPRWRGSPRAPPRTREPGTPSITNPRFSSWSLQEASLQGHRHLTQLVVLLTAPVADPEKIVLSGANDSRIAGNQPKPLRQRKDSTWHLHAPRSAGGRLQEAQHHHHSSGSARPALEPAALFTAAPKHYVSETAELTNLTFPKPLPFFLKPKILAKQWRASCCSVSRGE